MVIVIKSPQGITIAKAKLKTEKQMRKKGFGKLGSLVIVIKSPKVITITTIKVETEKTIEKKTDLVN